MVATETFIIPVQNIEILEEKIAKLNKRSTKLGLEPMELVLGEESVVKMHSSTHGEIDVRCREVSINGNSPLVEGWKLVAKITPEEAGNLVKHVPGEEVPKSYRDADPKQCDHCNTRRQRKDVFILQHLDGSYKQVGRNCIADFLGHKSPEALLSRCDHLISLLQDCDDAQDYEWGGGGGRPEAALLNLLAVSALYIRRLGWIPKSGNTELTDRRPS